MLDDGCKGINWSLICGSTLLKGKCFCHLITYCRASSIIGCILIDAGAVCKEAVELKLEEGKVAEVYDG